MRSPGCSNTRAAASRLRIPVEVYDAHRAAGRKWCWRHREFHELAEFGRVSERRDGLRAECRRAHNDALAEQRERKRAAGKVAA